ncbi:probable thimet oligopeptidase isoform X2 [Ananas comosus]|uniref:Probable thimet oligopeptidase isoform X2 n=1 Tax=Ananas comosus TaxID=4615 RepID=A0A6P5ENW7_ANACO|nr:probable thimet oligopeptidase isoform X2 [Ananas comosus]
MGARKRERRILALTGAAALLALSVNLIISAINAHNGSSKRKKKKRDLPCSSVHISLSASEIDRLTDHIIAKSKDTYDLVASVPLGKVSYANVISPLAELEAQQFPLIQSCVFPKMVSTLDDVRKASCEAEKRLDSHLLMCRKREDVYRVVKAYADRGEQLGSEAQRYVQCLVREFERHGVKLTLSKRNEMENLKSRIDELSLKYIENLNAGTKFVLLNEQELAGMPREFLMELEKTDGKLKVLLTNFHVTPILEHCKIGASRKLIAVAYGQRGGAENLDILESLVESRHKFSQLLGYSSYAELVLEPRMARTSSKVFEFLEEVSANLNDLATRELKVLKDLKRKEEGDSPFGMEDFLFYMRRAEEQQLDLEFGEVKQYFPVSLVLSGIFKIFQDLFGLRFEEVKDCETWHDTVRLFAVRDVTSNDLLGYFYLDTFFREGKFAHTCVVPLQNGWLASNGTRKVAIALLISQCPKQIDGNPALLRFSEVVSLFHEFSHVVHHMCNRATFSRFSGLRSEGDFIEIPSQLLERWCYESVSLKMMSGFHQDMTKSITSEMCKSLKRRHDSFAGLKLKQEILLCLADQIIHSSENVDIVELLKHLHPKVMLGIPLLEGTNPASCFSRLAIGYEAICYSYIWSEVFAADIFASKFQDDLLNHYAGLQFRNKVLAPGGAKDPLEILSDYLGREPSIRPFIETVHFDLSIVHRVTSL